MAVPEEMHSNTYIKNRIMPKENAKTSKEIMPEEMTKSLLKQLHEQYAINNNSKSSSLITLIGAFLIALSGYGCALNEYIGCSGKLKLLLLSVVAAQLVLLLLYILTIYLGSDQRMEQFITYQIRAEFMNGEMEKIFPAGYNPFGKSFFKFVQGIYNTLSLFFLSAIVLIPCSFIWVTNQNKYDAIPITISIVSMVICVIYKVRRYKKYLDRCTEYNEKAGI